MEASRHSYSNKAGLGILFLSGHVMNTEGCPLHDWVAVSRFSYEVSQNERWLGFSRVHLQHSFSLLMALTPLKPENETARQLRLGSLTGDSDTSCMSSSQAGHEKNPRGGLGS